MFPAFRKGTVSRLYRKGFFRWIRISNLVYWTMTASFSCFFHFPYLQNFCTFVLNSLFSQNKKEVKVFNYFVPSFSKRDSFWRFFRKGFFTEFEINCTEYWWLLFPVLLFPLFAEFSYFSAIFLIFAKKRLKFIYFSFQLF